MEPLLTESPDGDRPREFPALDVVDVHRRFRDVEALRGVTLEVWPGEVHALLGPNGAGKTTLLRILVGLLIPDAGDVGVLGQPLDAMTSRHFRRSFGFVPSGDRSFYLRVSGAENLLFFARLHGLPKRQAATRVPRAPGDGRSRGGRGPPGGSLLARDAEAPVGRSRPPHGATDPLRGRSHARPGSSRRRTDPGARTRTGPRAASRSSGRRNGSRRSEASPITSRCCKAGTVRFQGTVPQLLASVPRRRFLVRVRPGADPDGDAGCRGRHWPSSREGSDPEHFVLGMAEGETLGRAIAALEASGMSILACTEEGSGVEEAFLFLTQEEQP